MKMQGNLHIANFHKSGHGMTKIENGQRDNAVLRLVDYYVNPIEGERFYLRMLLMIVKGAKDYKDIRTYNGTVYSTFREACAARGLLIGQPLDN